MKHILLTNDDGIQAPGLQILARACRQLGTITIIAPEQDSSAASHSLTMNRPLRVRRIDENTFALNGTPTDCMMIGIGKILERQPDLVISGINPGPNLGDDISYSGTVSAAIEATMLGINAMAVSLAAHFDPLHYETAADLSVRLAQVIFVKGLPQDTLLNVNVPNTTMDKIAGIVFTRRGRRKYEDAIKETYDPWNRKHYWIGGGTPSFDADEDTDSAAVSVNKVSITPMHLDPTNYEALTFLQEKWNNLL